MDREKEPFLNLYDALSPYYDVVFPVKKPVVDFLAGQFGHPAGKILLDAACGTGGHALALAERNFSVVGIDLHPHMIEQARNKAAQLKTYSGNRPRFEVMDMEAVHPEKLGRWDGVYCIGNSLPHLLDVERMRATLQTWERGMNQHSEQRIIIQVVHFVKVLREGGQLPTLEGKASEAHIRFERRYEPEPSGTIRFLTNLSITQEKEEGTIAEEDGQNWTAETRLLPLSADDLETMLRSLGYRNLQWYGDLTGKPLTESSPAVVVSAGK
ncbi:methyltransferase domain-containing protein [Heliobacillus mobilis]|uniref:Methyltransferase domain-containing protein n=1 Tax=Heliobacterium mobile TaxID=28064 RepID=A0A6I3SNF3_HELMO|nr:class I SAM-dependent methyltransferase [Heliobacterium mobile]MTV50560.1 methyltransferase domain-containing protein [Heliobacterium mobile]